MGTKNIIIVTDCKDIALEQIKARFTAFFPDSLLNIFEMITPPFEIHNGLFLSKLIAEEVHHGNNTLFLAIINPCKSKPKRIFGKLKNGSWFVGADTGIFDEFGIAELYQCRKQLHYPFGGLHAHTITAASLLKGVLPEEIGIKMTGHHVKKIYPSKGEVVHIDNFGLIKLWLRVADINFKEGEKLRIKVLNSNIVLEAEFSYRMMDYEDNSLIIYPGSSLLDKTIRQNEDAYSKSGLIEIGLVRNTNTAKDLRIKLGDIIEIEPDKKLGSKLNT